MPAIDPPEEPQGELLRAIGLGRSRETGGDDRCRELMRISHDPMMVRDFLARQVREVPRSRVPRCPPAMSFLERLRWGEVPQDGSAKLDAYGSSELPSGTSVRAEVYAATSEDREPSWGDAARSRGTQGLRLFWPIVLVVAAVCAAMNLILPV